MKQMGEGLYEVPSDTDASRTYIVNMTGAYPQCTCTAWAFNRNRAKRDGTLPKPCKHCTAVMRIPQSGWAEMKAKEADAAAAAKVAAENEKQAQADKMKAELLKMRNDLEGKPTIKKAAAVAKAVDALKIDPGAADDLIAEAQSVPVIPDKAPKRQSAPTDLMAQLEAAIEAQKGT